MRPFFHVFQPRDLLIGKIKGKGSRVGGHDFKTTIGIGYIISSFNSFKASNYGLELS